MLNSKMHIQNAALLRRFLLVPMALSLLTACQQGSQSASDSTLACAATTPINGIQGHTDQSPMINEFVHTTGIVTRVEQDGYFLQSSATTDDGNPVTSEALWLETSDKPEPGNRVAVEGQVAELATDNPGQTITALVGSYWQLCEENETLPVQAMQRFDHPESVEHMRLSLDEGWQVADLYPLRDQRLRIASERLFVPTQIVSPGDAANQMVQRNTRRSVIIDWSSSGASVNSRLRAGDHLKPLTGIFDLRIPRSALLAETAPQVLHAASVPVPPQRDGHQLRVVSMNVENLFNGDGNGGGFPAPRGAQTAEQYQQQLTQLVNAIDALSPDILAVMELENDGYSSDSAIAQLTTALDRLPEQRWAFARPAEDRLGDDVIAVGLLYRSDVVSTQGESASIQTRPFDGLSRAPLAQRFQVNDQPFSVLIAVNHFKSKGSCPEGNARNSNQNDGQACWNEARERSSMVLSDWVEQLQQDWNEPYALIVGDLNSYRMEDPIRALIRAGWTDVAGQFLEPPVYSYRYYGEIGTLDYAFASAALIRQVADADIWHINSDATPGEQVPSTSLGIGRFSDHDPVIVDIALPVSVSIEPLEEPWTPQPEKPEASF